MTNLNKQKSYPQISRDRKNGGYFVWWGQRVRSPLTHLKKAGALAEMNGKNIGGFTKI